MQPWEQPTERQLEFVADLRRELRMPASLLDNHCERLFRKPFADLTKAECSELLNDMLTWKAIPADLQRLQGQQDLFAL